MCPFNSLWWVDDWRGDRFYIYIIYIAQIDIWRYEYFVSLHIHMCLISVHGIEHGVIIISATMNTTSVYILVSEHNLLRKKNDISHRKELFYSKAGVEKTRETITQWRWDGHVQIK